MNGRPEGERKRDSKRILIVDDAATVRMYHRGILESAG